MIILQGFCLKEKCMKFGFGVIFHDLCFFNFLASPNKKQHIPPSQKMRVESGRLPRRWPRATASHQRSSDAAPIELRMREIEETGSDDSDDEWGMEGKVCFPLTQQSFFFC